MGEREHDGDLVTVGRVVSVNFPKRQLRVLCETAHPERFHNMSRIRLKTAAGDLKEFDVEHAELLEGKVLITLDSGCSDEQIASTKKALVVVREDEKYPLDNDEHYLDDLIDMRVVDTSGRVLGRLHAVYTTGANDVYEVLDEQGRELMVPAVKDRIVNVDVANGVLTLDPEGLLES